MKGEEEKRRKKHKEQKKEKGLKREQKKSYIKINVDVFSVSFIWRVKVSNSFAKNEHRKIIMIFFLIASQVIIPKKKKYLCAWKKEKFEIRKRKLWTRRLHTKK